MSGQQGKDLGGSQARPAQVRTLATAPKRRLCCAKGCRRVAREAWDCRGNGSVFQPQPRERHYEVCEQHSLEFFGERAGWLHKDKSARIAERLVAR